MRAGLAGRLSRSMYNPPVRRFIALVVILLAVALVILSLGELETILMTLRQAHLRYVMLGLLLQLLWFVVLGRMYQSIYRLLDLNETVPTLSRLAAAANFINVVAPAVGMGGIALFADEARRRGHPAGRVTAAAALFYLFDLAAYFCVLALGLLILFRRNDLSASEITASLILLAIALTYALILYLGYRSAQRLGEILAGMAGTVNRVARPLLHRDYLSQARAHEFAHEIAAGLAGVPELPRSLVSPIFWGLLNKSLLMAVLLCAFLAFEVSFSVGTIIAGFALAYLFVVLSPTPAGIGVVEGLMPLALSSLRVDWSQAVIVTLMYRALTFWLPLGIGALAFRSLHQRAVDT